MSAPQLDSLAALRFKVATLLRPDPQSGTGQYLLPCFLAQGQSHKVIEICLDVGNSRPGPVRAEEGLVGDFFQSWKVLEQGFGWYATDVQKYIGMPSQKEECGVHPERPAPVREKDFQLGEIHRHIVDVDGISIPVASPVKN